MNACYPEDVFKDFLNERLGEPDASELSAHLAGCTSCQSRLDALSDDAELSSWKVSLKRAQTKKFSSTLPDPLLARLRRIPRLQAATAQPQEQNSDNEQFLPTESMRLSDVGGGNREPQTGLLPRIGQYEIVRAIGYGGMGVVYEARHTVLKNRVALKVVAPKRLSDEVSVARFHREMEAVGQLSHPNIVKATDASQSEGRCFLVMEYVDGCDLGEAVGAVGPLPVADACEVVRQAAVGLAHVDDHGLIHRDLKPSNLLLGTDGFVKVTDLGLARLHVSHSPEQFITSTGQVMGTVDYIAPEQAYDTRNADIRSDLYALGGTLFHLLTGRPPFESDTYDTAMKKLMAHIHDVPASISDLRQEVPCDVAAIVSRLLEKEPDARFQTPTELAEALEPFCEGADLPELARRAAANRDDRFEVRADDRTPPLGGPDMETTFAHRGPRLARSKPETRSRRSSGRLAAIAAGVLILGTATGALILLNRPDPKEQKTLAPRIHGFPPVVMDWNKDVPAQEKNPLHTEESGAITVTPRGSHAWVKLGEFDDSIREISIDVTQFVDWKGFFGLFFDPRPTEFQRQPCMKYQMIRFFRDSPRAGGQLRVELAEVLLSREPGHFEYPEPQLTGRKRFPPLSPGETVTLTVQFDKSRVTEVLLNGDRIPFFPSDQEPLKKRKIFNKIPDKSPWGCYTADGAVVRYSKPIINTD